MKNLFFALSMVLSVPAFALNCNLAVDPNTYQSKVFSGTTRSVDFSGDAYASCYEAEVEALSKCRKSGYNHKCEELTSKKSKVGMVLSTTSEGHSFQKCTAYYRGHKITGKKSKEEIRDEKCQKILDCQNNARTAEDLEMLVKLNDLNKC